VCVICEKGRVTKKKGHKTVVLQMCKAETITGGKFICKSWILCNSEWNLLGSTYMLRQVMCMYFYAMTYALIDYLT